MRLAAILLVFKEQHFVKATISAIYPVVDSICCVTQYDRTWKGKEISPDETIATILGLPDPENKIRLIIRRQLDDVPGNDNEARLRNIAMQQDPKADYYLIIDSDEIWETAVLKRAWEHVQKTRMSAYLCSTYCYFRSWNFRVDEVDPYQPLVFLRKGFRFKAIRRIDWWTLPGRFLEYIRLIHKPKTVRLPGNLKLHHGSCVGDDDRILTKLTHYSHQDEVDPGWFDRVWKNFSENTKDFHFAQGEASRYKGITIVPTKDLPPEIREMEWPAGWVKRDGADQK
jgi:hypothetical protein